MEKRTIEPKDSVISKKSLWKKFLNAKTNKIVLGADIGTGLALILSNYKLILGALILVASPQITKFMKASQNYLNREQINEIMEMRHKLRHQSLQNKAKGILDNPTLAPAILVDKFNNDFKNLKNLTDGELKTKVLLTMVSIIVLIAPQRPEIVKPLNKILRYIS